MHIQTKTCKCRKVWTLGNCVFHPFPSPTPFNHRVLMQFNFLLVPNSLPSHTLFSPSFFPIVNILLQNLSALQLQSRSRVGRQFNLLLICFKGMILKGFNHFVFIFSIFWEIAEICSKPTSKLKGEGHFYQNFSRL